MTEVQAAILETDVIQGGGHFRFASGCHSDVKVDMPRILSHPEQANTVGNNLRAVLKDSKVVAPVPNGALEIADAWLPNDHDVVRAAKLTPEIFVLHLMWSAMLRSTYDITVFEDVVTTALSAASLGRAILEVNPKAKLHLVGIWRRDEVLAEHASLFSSQTYLVEEPIPSWPGEECYCAKEGDTIII